jgi:ribonuclease PH
MTAAKRHDGRGANELRPVKLTTTYVPTADGSCLIQLGQTRVICTASLTEGVPDWREGTGRGWVTAEYGMLPASTAQRRRRPIGRLDGRSAEIQRLIGRVLRSVTAMEKLGENTMYLDCDVLTADGGTRTAAITGAYVALAQAVAAGRKAGRLPAGVLIEPVAAVSVGIVDGRPLLDLDYAEDGKCEVDMNLAMTKAGRYVEIQGTGEGRSFDQGQLQAMLRLGKAGVRKLVAAQLQAIRKMK